MQLLLADRAGFRYRTGHWGIRHLDLEVNEGEVIGVIGANGAGKSTTLTLCSGLVAPTEGSIARDPAIRFVGWCPQRDLVDWSLTVRQNILLPLAVLGLPRAAANRRVEEVMALVEIESVADRQVELISGGQLRRVQVARALATNARLLILDEPASGLDPEGTERLYAHLAAEAAENGTAVIVSSHDLGVLERTATRVVEISNGACVFDGTTASYVQAGAFAEIVIVANFKQGESDPSIQRLSELPGVAIDRESDNSVRIRVANPADLGAVLQDVVNAAGFEGLSIGRTSLREAYLAQRSGVGEG